MTKYVVTLEDFRPGQRYDGTPWTKARIDEASDPAGPFEQIDLLDLSPVDDDPENPRSRNLTSAEASSAAGWFRVTFVDDDGAEQATEPVFFPGAGSTIAPDIADVGALLRARTKDTAGNELGTFTEQTRPTHRQVVVLIEQAAEDVAGRVGENVPEALRGFARALVALRAAMLIEASYFPEQVDTAGSPYREFRFTYENTIGRLVDATQLRDAFGEKVGIS